MYIISDMQLSVFARPSLSSVLKARFRREKKLFILSLFMKLMSSTAEHRDSWLSSQVCTVEFPVTSFCAIIMSTLICKMGLPFWGEKGCELAQDNAGSNC